MNKFQIGIVMVAVSTAVGSTMLVGGCSSSSSPSPDAGTSSSSGGSGSSSGSSSSSGGSSSGSSSSSSGSSSGGGVDAGDAGGKFPPVPVLAATFIDRLGRAAVNTALNDEFDTNTATQGMKKNAYNQDANEMTYATTYTPEFAASLGIYDSLDGVCGNQLLAAAASADAGTDGGIPANRYQTLASTLANDTILMDTSTGTCAQYLAVELKATGIMPNLTDCGGRTPLYNVMDITYSALAIGKTTGVTSGITVDAETQSTTTFPFLAAPH